MVDREVVRIALIDQHSFRPDHELRFLAVEKRANGMHDGYVEFVGGGVERGEDSIAALVREVQEELGTPLERVRLRPIGEGVTLLEDKRERQYWQLYVGWAPFEDSIELSAELARTVAIPVSELESRMNRYSDLREQARLAARWGEAVFDAYRCT